MINRQFYMLQKLLYIFSQNLSNVDLIHACSTFFRLKYMCISNQYENHYFCRIFFCFMHLATDLKNQKVTRITYLSDDSIRTYRINVKIIIFAGT